jgi:hypothetical protein
MHFCHYVDIGPQNLCKNQSIESDSSANEIIQAIQQVLS